MNDLLLLATTVATTSLIFTATVSSTHPCGNDEWEYYNGFCYWSSYYQKTNVNNWYGASLDCLRKGSVLVSIHSKEENRFIHRLSRCSDTWIGIMMTNPSRKSSTDGYSWVDGSPMDFLSWRYGYPKSQYYDCALLYSGTIGQWSSHQNCGSYRTNYVCKRQASGSGTAGRKRGPCPQNWFVQGGKCYHINSTKVDFFAASLHCESLNSKLVTLHSKNEVIDLGRVFNSCETPWIGLQNTDPKKVTYNSGWRWADNTALDFSNWRYGGIRKDYTRQCGIFQRDSKWDNVYCWELHPFVCEKPNPVTSN